MKHNYLREEERKKKTNKRNMALLAVAAIVLFFGSFLAVQGLMSLSLIHILRRWDSKDGVYSWLTLS